MGKSITRSIYMNPKLVTAFKVFFEVIDGLKSQEDGEYLWHKKSEILDMLNQKKVFISLSTLNVFIELRIQLQKNSKKLIQHKGVIQIIEDF